MKDFHRTLGDKRIAVDVQSYIMRPKAYQAILSMKSTLVSVLAIAGTVVVSAQAPATNWSQFRANSRLTGVTSDAPSSTLTPRWTYEAGGAIESSAAIVDGVVYVGSSTGTLLAIDLETGTLRWKYTTGDGGSIGESSPAVGGNAVFVGDLNGTVHAVNVRDGSGLWTFKTGDEVHSSPTLVGDLVLIGSYDTYLYALERDTGKLRW